MTMTNDAAPNVVDDQVQEMAPPAASRFWQLQLAMAKAECKDWHDEGDKVQERYRNDKKIATRSKRTAKRFAILYSNTETLKSALYASTPKPDVRRRWTAERNPVARKAAEVLERSLSYCADNTEHDRAYRAGVHDLTLPGRGVVRLVYEARVEQVQTVDPMTGLPAMTEQVVDQDVKEQHVFWKDVLWSPSRCWNDVWWMAFRHRMTREDLRENGFEDAESIPLNWQPEVASNDREMPEDLKRAEVWEIWSKTHRKRYWIVEGHPVALKIEDDPYELEGFWPLPEPLSAVLDTATWVPVPYYAEYEDQANDLDEITGRISILIKALKRRGVYDASVKELKRLARANDNEFIGVDGSKYNLIAQGGGLAKAFETEDVAPLAQVLLGLYEQRDRLISSIYEITGISDILRGSSNPNETATAQNIKAQFGSMRMKDAQREVQRWVRDSYRIKAELICQNFTPERLAEITGNQVGDPEFMQAVELLRSDERRAYQVDIETDSTVFEDAEQEKNNRVELLTAMSQFMEKSVPLAQGVPELSPLLFEMLAFGVRGFKAGRQLEDLLDETMQQMQLARQQAAQQPPQPSPEELEAQRDQQRHEHDMEMKAMDRQDKVIDLQVHQQKAAADIQKTEAVTNAAIIKAETSARQAGQPTDGR